MASKTIDLAAMLEQSLAEKAKKRAAKKDGKRKKGASTSGVAVIDLIEPPRVEVPAVAATPQHPSEDQVPEPAPKRQKLVLRRGKPAEVANPQVEIPVLPIGPADRSEQDDVSADDLPLSSRVLRGLRSKSTLPPRSSSEPAPHESSFRGQSPSTVQLEIGHTESFKNAAVARAYSKRMFTEADLARLGTMKQHRLNFTEALEKHTLEGLLLLRGLREEDELALDNQMRLRNKLRDETSDRKKAEKREAEASYAQEKLKEAMEKLERLLEQKEEQFSQAQVKVAELSEAAQLAENKYQAAVLEHKLKETAHQEESEKLKEENRRLGQALENLEAVKLREKEEAVEKAAKAAVEEFRASDAYRADLISEALPSYELGLRKYRAVVLEVSPDFDIKVADSRCDLSDGEGEEDEDNEEEEHRDEDKLPLEAPATEVRVALEAVEEASSEIDKEKVGSHELPDPELSPPPPEGPSEETPAPPAETS